ncbi:MAG TPA: alpha/beta hydrolase [Roseiflexaceae bacterium]|nr:alpha/beta hydrolase [Roseiflexaceae bacterium]
MSGTIPLWPGKAPGSENWRQREKDYIFREPWPHRITRNVVTPTLTLYLPRNATGTGVVVAPGGAHHFLAVDHEGVEVANWLTARGIAAFVLKYRVIETSDDDQIFLQERLQIMERLRDRMAAHWPLALADGQQAIRLVRQRAAEWGVRPDRIGMLGFSAGGHLAAGVALANQPRQSAGFHCADLRRGAPGDPCAGQCPAALHRPGERRSNRGRFVCRALQCVAGRRAPGRDPQLRTGRPRLRHGAPGPAGRWLAGSVCRMACRPGAAGVGIGVVRSTSGARPNPHTLATLPPYFLNTSCLSYLHR